MAYNVLNFNEKKTEVMVFSFTTETPPVEESWFCSPVYQVNRHKPWG